jgi:hypothetical protein
MSCLNSSAMLFHCFPGAVLVARHVAVTHLREEIESSDTFQDIVPCLTRPSLRFGQKPSDVSGLRMDVTADVNDRGRLEI